MEKLQRNVNEWKESYDMLMNEFRKLKLETIVEKEKLIKEVKILSSGAKVRHVFNSHSRVYHIPFLRICNKKSVV